MALGLGAKIPASRIESLYRDDGKKIFSQRLSWRYFGGFLKLIRQVRRTLYDYEVLMQLLYREFGDKTLGDSTARLVIPAFQAPKTEIAVFKTDHHPDFKKDHQSKMWEVARATSAAPTYFKGHEQEGTIFLDGGIWANNPVMVAIVDALSAYDISRDQIRVLSIGAGNPPFEIALKYAKRGFWRWKKIIKAAMFLTTDNAQAQAGLLLGPENILRLEPTGSAAAIELDDWEAAVKTLPQMANLHFNKNKQTIQKFFELEAEPRQRFYT